MRVIYFSNTGEVNFFVHFVTLTHSYSLTTHTNFTYIGNTKLL